MGKIYIVGIGPGCHEDMTLRADKALGESDVIAGYTVYVDLVRDYYSDKEFISTPMMGEVNRCRMALEEAQKGKTVSMVCSGDAGVYGMAGLIYELSEEYDTVDIQVIPGITSALSGGALTGAPLTHDFAVVSLSDLLTPWEKIECRLREASKADFTLCLYNPSSKKRHDYLEKACRICMEYKSEETVCAIAKNIGREGEAYQVMTLKELAVTSVDMFTTVFIGNSQSRVINGKMVTPRGYMEKEHGKK